MNLVSAVRFEIPNYGCFGPLYCISLRVIVYFAAFLIISFCNHFGLIPYNVRFDSYIPLAMGLFRLWLSSLNTYWQFVRLFCLVVKITIINWMFSHSVDTGNKICGIGGFHTSSSNDRIRFHSTLSFSYIETLHLTPER